MYKYVVFDIDGTLIDTEKAILCALQKMLRVEKEMQYTAEELSFVLGIPGQVALKKLKVADIEQANRQWNGYMRDYDHYVRVYPGIENVVMLLRAMGVVTGIVTSKTRQEYEADFKPVGLYHLFDYVVCADETRRQKPYADPLLKALRMASLKPENCLYIGDTVYDATCAQRAGVDFGLALWGTRNHEIMAAYKFAGPDDILALFDSSKTKIIHK